MLLISNLPSPHPNLPSLTLLLRALALMSDPQTEQPTNTKLFVTPPIIFKKIFINHGVVLAIMKNFNCSIIQRFWKT